MLHKEFLCCHEGCSGIICLTPAQESRMRRTHEDFRCPYGHVQGFYGENEQEKTIRQLRERLAQKQNLLDYRQQTIDSLRAELRSRSARIGRKTRQLNAYRRKSRT